MKLPFKVFASSAATVCVVALIVFRVRGDSHAAVPAVATTEIRPAGAPASKSAPRAEPLRVSTLVVRTQPLVETVTATGTLRAEESVDLQAEVSGKITAINFQEGRRVRKGDLLMKVNDAELVAMLARAKARLDLAAQRVARFSQLAAAGGINEQDFDTERSELAVQQAEVDLIKAQIAKTELRAPFDGVIGLRFVSEGAFITATSNNAMRVATLQSIDNLKIDFALPEKYAGRIRIGGAISFVVAGYEQRFQGEVYAFEPRIDVATRTLSIRALCPNVGAALVPGGFATLQIKMDEVENAVVVPANAVIPGLNEKTVYVVKDGKAVRRAVQTGMRTETSVHIVSGLKPGEVLVLSGLQQMRQGQLLEAVMVDEPLAPSTALASHTGSGAASK
jgi:membrane fusion protein (multidrug efflux system)